MSIIGTYSAISLKTINTDFIIKLRVLWYLW